jgi:hypothetical protein
MHFAGSFSCKERIVTRINNKVSMQGRAPHFYGGTWVLIVRTNRLVRVVTNGLALLGVV